MDFLNEPVHIESLPRVEAVSLNPLEPTYRRVLVLEWAISLAVSLAVLAALIGFIPPLRQPVWILAGAGAWLLLAVTWFLLMQKSFRNKGYAIRQRDVIYRSGWIIQRTHACPFNRIQHSTVTMGPLERRFNLATLVLYTAGSGEADLRIPGLTADTARSLKEWITKKIADEPADAI